jgi:hypothetical protein
MDSGSALIAHPSVASWEVVYGFDPNRFLALVLSGQTAAHERGHPHRMTASLVSERRS